VLLVEAFKDFVLERGLSARGTGQEYELRGVDTLHLPDLTPFSWTPT